MRKKKINVMFFTNNTLMYGANRSLLGLVNSFSEMVEPIIILPKKGEFYYECKKSNLRTFVLPFYALAYKKEGSIFNKIKFSIRYLQYNLINPISLLILFIIFRNKKIDIIHSNTSILDIGFNLASRINSKHIFHLREFQDLDYKLTRLIKERSYYQKLNDSNKNIAISKSIASHYPINVEVIYNGVVKRSNFYLDGNIEPFFLICSNLVPGKNLTDAIHAFNKFQLKTENNKYKLIILGDGEPWYKKELIELSREYKLENKIVFKGFCNDCLPYMRKATALLMCSKNEGLGRVTIEAMASGCVVIGYDGGGTSELIEHNETGFLYYTLDELVYYIRQVCTKDFDRVKMTQKAFTFAINNFVVEDYSKRIENEYVKLLQS